MKSEESLCSVHEQQQQQQQQQVFFIVHSGCRRSERLRSALLDGRSGFRRISELTILVVRRWERED